MLQKLLLRTLPVFFLGLGACSTNAPQAREPVSAEEVLSSLKTGNQRFVSGRVRSDGQSKADIERLASGQSPRAIVLSCSDSRLPPETIFDQKLGEIFTVRSAGEALSPQAIASIEFAVAKLGSKLIVVLGHTSCGAVKAAVDTMDGSSAGSPNLDQLVADIRPRIAASVKAKKPEKDLRDPSTANARGIAKDLLARSKILSDAVQSGAVKIQVGLYDLGTGLVEF